MADKVHKRAILVGDRTHGKGSVQGITNYPGEDSKLKYTMAYYYLPSGQKVENRYIAEDWGISPDVNVTLHSDELQKINDVQRANEVIVKASQTEALNKLKPYSNRQTIDSDPQLAIGLLVLKSKMIQSAL